MGRERVFRPQRGEGIRRSLGYMVGLLAGLISVTLGFALGFANGAARLHFDDAEKMPAVVVTADYAKPQLKESPSSIRVSLAGVPDGWASIDNVLLAPGGLSTGDRVTVLYDAERPGHALFPSQLGWTKLMFPGGLLFLVGLVPTIGYGLAIARKVAVYFRR
ncbi:DUF3592 domain-containing protein [Streptomyces turgidiscabies]|uniref:DUF3592 domain-containing protein n=1 Tax=Streptomyces turgidiscabies TaxID=85558 RepID=UPI0029BFEA62|nr:DUF3592 domain-containing protein [Streptomyces turgidiscabies]